MAIDLLWSIDQFIGIFPMISSAQVLIKKGLTPCRIQNSNRTMPWNANDGAGIFTYKTGSFMGQMLVNIPYVEHMGWAIHIFVISHGSHGEKSWADKDLQNDKVSMGDSMEDIIHWDQNPVSVTFRFTVLGVGDISINFDCSTETLKDTKPDL